jgi:large subunit ribosomal protein L31e
MVKADLVTRDFTIHLQKRVVGTTHKKKAPKAIKVIKEFATKMMKTSDVRLSADLNKAVWANGIKNVPARLRIRLSRKRNDDEEAKEKLYTLVEHVTVDSFKGLQTETKL